MSKYGNYLKARKDSNKDFFFGEGNWENKTNKYINYKSVIDEENIIIRTNNVKMIKENFVLIVDNNKAVYLKDWQVKSFSNYYNGLDGWLVKLNKKFFKPYTFKFNFDDMSFEKEETFEDLLLVAKEQELANMTVKI